MMNNFIYLFKLFTNFIYFSYEYHKQIRNLIIVNSLTVCITYVNIYFEKIVLLAIA